MRIMISPLSARVRSRAQTLTSSLERAGFESITVDGPTSRAFLVLMRKPAANTR